MIDVPPALTTHSVSTDPQSELPHPFASHLLSSVIPLKKFCATGQAQYNWEMLVFWYLTQQVISFQAQRLWKKAGFLRLFWNGVCLGGMVDFDSLIFLDKSVWSFRSQCWLIGRDNECCTNLAAHFVEPPLGNCGSGVFKAGIWSSCCGSGFRGRVLQAMVGGGSNC